MSPISIFIQYFNEGDLPLVSDKFRRGEVSYSKVRAITRVASLENEEYLLKIARHGTAAHVERLVRNYKKVKRNEALARDNERHVFTLTTGNRLSGLNVTPETGKCQWGGEQMDDDLAILCMLQLE